MKTPNRERQKRWKEKQVSEGKKSLSVMVAAETKALIDKERKRTGETIASIIERAITNLFRPGTEVPDVDEVSVTSNSTVTSNSMKDIIKSHPNAKGIYQAVGLLHNTGANIKTMVYTLNAWKYKTFFGKDEWTEKDVKEILDVVENNRALYLEIIYGT